MLESISGPWVCFGDFIIVISDDEKAGGKLGSFSTPNYLKDMLFNLGVVDLGYSGNKFTWHNKSWGRHAIRERLDRGIASIDWRLKFPKVIIHHLGTINSDNCPILLVTNPSEDSTPRPFRLEAAWTRDPRCHGVIQRAWNKEVRGSRGYRLDRMQQSTCEAFKKWNKKEFGHTQERIKVLSFQLQEIQKEEPTEENCKVEVKLQAGMNEWLAGDELLWR
jgi:hypothetical protein|uniref:Endonuclease/exonuclease/phosphatase domain-containing protein n=1 Tax=Fagus sylvatica TaxID=28930 RepID=A0A2N9FLB1_FAGSY